MRHLLCVITLLIFVFMWRFACWLRDRTDLWSTELSFVIIVQGMQEDFRLWRLVKYFFSFVSLIFYNLIRLCRFYVICEHANFSMLICDLISFPSSIMSFDYVTWLWWSFEAYVVKYIVWFGLLHFKNRIDLAHHHWTL